MDYARYPGAVLVGNILRVGAWIVFVGGLLAALGFALSYDCAETASQECENETAIRLGLFFGIAVVSTLYALVMWAVGYVLLLLCEIEANTAGEQDEEED
ncbi:MAG: hypothetical protein ACUVV3_10720 [Dehalococcoidia bacterium]